MTRRIRLAFVFSSLALYPACGTDASPSAAVAQDPTMGPPVTDEGSDWGGDSTDPQDATPSDAEQPALAPDSNSGLRGRTTCLNADGPAGADTYDLIQSVLGRGAVENRGDANHSPPVRHVLEAIDPVVGPHFVVLSHSLVDRDGDNLDRSRTEIKVAPSSGSNDALKGREGNTFAYSWRFRINANMTFSNRFTHMFQFKSSGGDDGAPLITITGRKSGTGDRLEIIHTGPPSLGKLAEASLAGLKGVWLSVSIVATFKDAGAFAISIKKPDGSVVLSTNSTGIDMWRAGDHIRPKWGIYRGLSNQLRTAEEDVRFANFAITPGGNPSTDCH